MGVFLLNTVSFLSVIAVLYLWRPTTKVGPAPAEPVLSAIRAGIRYARHAPALARACSCRAIRFVRECALGVVASAGSTRGA